MSCHLDCLDQAALESILGKTKVDRIALPQTADGSFDRDLAIDLLRSFFGGGGNNNTNNNNTEIKWKRAKQQQRAKAEERAAVAALFATREAVKANRKVVDVDDYPSNVGEKRKRQSPSATKPKCPVCLCDGSAFEFAWQCTHGACSTCLSKMKKHGISQCPVCRTGSISIIN